MTVGWAAVGLDRGVLRNRKLENAALGDKGLSVLRNAVQQLLRAWLHLLNVPGHMASACHLLYMKVIYIHD